MNHELAARLHKTISAGIALLDDQTASEGVEIFPRLKGDGAMINAGTRIRWNGVLKRAAVDLWDTEENNPENAPTLWEDIAYREGYRIIPETITSTLAFALSETGWWNGRLYRSLRDGNTFTPDETPEWWEEVTA